MNFFLKSVFFTSRSTLLILIFSSIFIVYSNAQQAFNGGFVSGINACQVDGDSYAGYNYLGLNFGMFTRTNSSKKLNIQGELRFDGRGAFANTGTKYYPRYYQLSLKYANLPITLQYTATEKLSLEAGLYYAHLFSARYYEDGVLIPTDEISPSFNNKDIGYILGLTYHINTHFAINTRFNYSLVPIRRRNLGRYYGWVSETLGLREGDYNNAISLSLYYTLGNNERN